MSSSIIEELQEVDWNKLADELSAFINRTVPSEKAGLIVGVSGGVDSACVLALCCRSVGSERVLGLILPDTRITPSVDLEDSRKLCARLGVASKELDISMLHSVFMKQLPRDRFAEGNLRARIRMSLLYFYANLQNRVVCGTGDRSESLIGYFTKYGDGGVDLSPIGGLYKCQVRGLARFLGLPSSIYLKESSPHLWLKHSAETEIGMTYDEIDSICYLLVDKKMVADEIASKTGIDKAKVERVLFLNRASAHKRVMPLAPTPVTVR